MIDERAAFFGMANISLSFQDAEGGQNRVISYGRVGQCRPTTSVTTADPLSQRISMMGSSASVSVGDCFRAMGDSLNELRIALIQFYNGGGQAVN